MRNDTGSPVVLVIGIGNDYRGDDSIGLVVARRLQTYTLPHTLILTEQREGTALIAAWDHTQAELVILIDAVSSGAEVGTISRMIATTDPVLLRQSTQSTHSLSVADAIELARILGKLPPRLILYMIEGRQFMLGSQPTHAVQNAAERVSDMIRAEITHFLKSLNLHTDFYDTRSTILKT